MRTIATKLRTFGAASLLSLAAAPLAAQPAALQVALAGQPEAVIPAESMRCADAIALPGRRAIDATDMPPAAFRRGDGSVLLLASNRANLMATGPSLDRVRRHDCKSLLPHQGDPDPARFRDSEWLFGLYSFDGRTVFGIVHDEYHGDDHALAGCPRPASRAELRNRSCWYSSSTLAVSSDGGFDFTRPAPPDSVLLAPPGRFVEGTGRVGSGGPKVVGAPDGRTAYVLVATSNGDEGQRIGQCLLRLAPGPLPGKTIWDGRGFVPYQPDPYVAGATGKPCVQVVPGNLTSVRWVPARKLYLGLFTGHFGIAARTSPDLIRWSEPQQIMTITSNAQWKPGDPAPTWYYSLLDPSSASRNFDTLEGRPYLYYVRFHVAGDRLQNGVRDVMRVPISIR